MPNHIEPLERRQLFATAPLYVQGITIRQVITDGLTDGAFDEGTTDTYFDEETEYSFISVTENLGDDTGGTYTYRRQRDGTGLMEFDDAEGVTGHLVYTFKTAASGTFRMWVEKDGDDVPFYDGTFTIHASIDFAEVVDGAINVTGTNARDAIDLSSNSSSVFVTRNGFTRTFARNSLAAGSSVLINTDDSEDFIDASKLTSNRIIASGGSGDDTIAGSMLDDQINGNAGRNRLLGNEGNDKLRGSNGRDFLYGGAGDDRLYGIDGDDSLDGGGGRNRLYGGAGNDLLIGGNSNDRLYGGDGNDALLGKRGNDVLNGGPGTDSHDDIDEDSLIAMP